MDLVELSDLEEGEILEFESLSPNYSKNDDVDFKSCPSECLKEYNKDIRLDLHEIENGTVHSGKEKNGCISKSLKEKLNLNGKVGDSMSNTRMVDLESISSEGEYKSDEEDKYCLCENKNYTYSNGKRKLKEKHSNHFYGTVEDIISEIEETICGKSSCIYYKKRKSKNSHYNLDKYPKSSYELWRHKIFSSQLNKKHKRKVSFSNADSDLVKDRTEKRKKKKKKREVYYGENEKPVKKRKIRDFDEARQNLLEKLKKQKAKEELKAFTNGSTLIVKDSDIQEVNMLINCTNYVDNLPDDIPKETARDESRTAEKDGEDELDVSKLRLIALASNKKQKCSGENISKTVTPEGVSGQNTSDNIKEEMDLDRNELLLRAEALKTALLKKHQKRLSQLKINKLRGSFNDHGVVNSLPPTEKNTDCFHSEKNNGDTNQDTCKENVRNETSGEREAVANWCCNTPAAHFSDLEMKINQIKGNVVEPSATSQDALSKVRGKRKRKKSEPCLKKLKENTGTGEALEEDDRALRNQLLKDLMKKKSLKNLEKKSVLMDSIQMSANKHPSSEVNNEPPKENVKFFPIVKKNLLKKINVPKRIKPLGTHKIPKPEFRRMIVHLGSEDSSDEDGEPSQTSLGIDVQKEQTLPVQEKEDKKNTVQAYYERSVELLLSQARKKVEGEKPSNVVATPEAVYKHLPPSQRLEYLRLKQKIAEREKLKKEKQENDSLLRRTSVDSRSLEVPVSSEKESFECNSAKCEPQSESVTKGCQNQTNLPLDSSLINKTVNNSKQFVSSFSKQRVAINSSSGIKKIGGNFTSLTDPKTKKLSLRLVNNDVKNNLTEIYGKGCKKYVPSSGNGLKPAVSIQRNRLLLPSSQALITKLKLLLKKIKIEKMIEENYEKEILKLKNQLSLFEKKKCEQRFKIKKLGEESMKTYKAIQGITAKATEKTMPKEESTERIDGEPKDEGKKQKEDEEEGKKVFNESETEKSKVQCKIDKELDKDGKVSENVACETTQDLCVLEYHSPLEHFNKVSDSAEKVDPNVVMCQFDLTGICKDKECAYQHLRTS